MSMNPVSRTLSDEDQRLVDEYLKNGGKITVGKSGKRTEDIEFKGSFYTKRKKKKEQGEEN